MSTIFSFLFRIAQKLVQILPGGYRLSRTRVVKGTYSFLTRKFRRKRVKVFGNIMYLDPEDNLELSFKGVHEPLTTRIFQQEVKLGDTVLDIGAHIGYYTLISAKIVGETGKVFSFEANPANFSLLEKNIETNGYNNVTIFQSAISDYQGNAKLFFERSSNTRWSSIYNIHNNGNYIDVKVSTVDELLKDYTGRVNFIKLDIEGAELAALRGLTNILTKNREMKIVVEFRPSILIRAGMDPRQFLDYFTENGFKLSYMDEVHDRIIPAGQEEIIKFCEQYLAANLLCKRAV